MAVLGVVLGCSPSEDAAEDPANPTAPSDGTGGDRSSAQSTTRVQDGDSTSGTTSGSGGDGPTSTNGSTSGAGASTGGPANVDGSGGLGEGGGSGSGADASGGEAGPKLYERFDQGFRNGSEIGTHSVAHHEVEEGEEVLTLGA